jgi:DNA-binding NarL/FixJ family response regulator
MSDKTNHSRKILIVDDDPLVCHTLRLQLERSGFKDLTVAHDGPETIRFASNYNPDLIMLDITMPEMDGLDVLSLVKSKSPSTKVLMLTAQERVDYVTEAIARGASGYLVKRVPDLETLAETINLLLDGDAIVVDKNLLQQAAKKAARIETKTDQGENSQILTKNLTRQELEVLRLIAAGLTNNEIASTLHISYNTVKSHVSSVYQKLKVTDRTQAAIVAIWRGITREE